MLYGYSQCYKSPIILVSDLQQRTAHLTRSAQDKAAPHVEPSPRLTVNLNVSLILPESEGTACSRIVPPDRAGNAGITHGSFQYGPIGHQLDKKVRVRYPDN